MQLHFGLFIMRQFKCKKKCSEYLNVLFLRLLEEEKLMLEIFNSFLVVVNYSSSLHHI